MPISPDLHREQINAYFEVNPTQRTLFRGDELVTAYSEGAEAGQRAQDAKELQAIEKKISTYAGWKSERPESDAIGHERSFRVGYCDGLAEFTTAHSIDPSRLGLCSEPSDLMKDSVLMGFLQGLRQRSLGVPRSFYMLPYNPDRFNTEKYTTPNRLKVIEEYPKYYNDESRDLNSKLTSDLLTTLMGEDLLRRRGWRLGFEVAIARTSGVVLSMAEIPTDNSAYGVFRRGQMGLEHPIDERHIQSPFFIKEPLIRNIESFSPPLGDFTLYDDRVYRGGLRVWLALEGVTGVAPEDIRHPIALQVFRTALRGDVLPQYEPRPFRDLSEFPAILGEKGKIINFYFPEIRHNKSEIRPYDAAEEQARRAYRLGKQAHNSRVTKNPQNPFGGLTK